MKALWLTKNRRERRGAPRLSLFPFLAVLICTMGALILLLLFVSRQARLQAAREASAKNAEKQSSIAAEMEMVQWRVEQLKKSRTETEAQLGEARLVLGHIEDHGRRLRDQFQDLSLQAKKASSEGLKPGRFVAAGAAELQQIEGQIAAAQQRLTQAQQVAANRPKTYAIVPYDGPNHTRRRPIYIECRGDMVVLQPENIRFTETDFDEPLGPGNPLAAAVRAAREQMLLQGGLDPQNSGEPYPLLLVRPSGIPAYNAALAAMKSWGSEFGYELINDDWQLNYPPPDRNLARAVDQAIFLARQEHARLIAAAPSKYGKRPRSGSFRSPTGDDAGTQGRAGEGESPGFYSSRPSDRYASNNGGGAPGASRSGSGSGGSGAKGEGGNGNGAGSAGGDSSGPSGDAEFLANNPYASLPTSGMAGPAGMNPAGMGTGPAYGPGNGMIGASGSGVAGGMAGPGGSPAGMGSGSGYGPGNAMGGVAGSGVAGGMAGPGGSPAGMGTGSGYGPGNAMGGVAGSGAAGGMAGPGGSPAGMGTGSGYGPGNAMGGAAGSGVAGGMAGSGGSPTGMGSGSSYGPGNAMGGVAGSGAAGGMAGSGGSSAGMGSGSGYGPGPAVAGDSGSGVAGGSPNINPAGNGNASGNAAATGMAGSPTTNSAAGTANNSAPSGNQGVMQSNGQQVGGSPSAVAVARPDGYINGRPNDGNPQPVQPAPSSSVAMAPAAPLRPGEWRPSAENTPPKPDPDAEAKEKAEKKKHPYDKVKLDHDQDDWALRNSTRHAAAISRPIHVDCYPDRIVLVSETASDEPRVILCENNGRRDADKFVAAVWEIMDTWGMAGREMYWRPILKFYVAPGAEPRMFDLTRSLEGSGLVIERKQ